MGMAQGRGGGRNSTQLLEAVGTGEDWECVKKVTVMSCTHKLRGFSGKVG